MNIEATVDDMTAAYIEVILVDEPAASLVVGAPVVGQE